MKRVGLGRHNKKNGGRKKKRERRKGRVGVCQGLERRKCQPSLGEGKKGWKKREGRRKGKGDEQEKRIIMSLLNHEEEKRAKRRERERKGMGEGVKRKGQQEKGKTFTILNGKR